MDKYLKMALIHFAIIALLIIWIVVDGCMAIGTGRSSTTLVCDAVGISVIAAIVIVVVVIVALEIKNRIGK